VPLRKFNQLQDEFLAVSKRMHEATGPHEKVTLLNRLKEILKQSKAVLEQIRQRQQR
jgi:hypothetical protein